MSEENDRKLIYLCVAGTLVMVLFFGLIAAMPTSEYVDDTPSLMPEMATAPEPVEMVTPTPEVVVSTPEPVSIPKVVYDDVEFLIWVEETRNVVSDYCFQSAAGVDINNEAATYTRIKWADIKDFNTSPELSTLKEEYKEFLCDISSAFEYTDLYYSEYGTEDDGKMVIEFTESAKEHLIKVIELLE